MQKCNIAILGAGNIARKFTEALYHVPGAVAYAAASRSLEKAQSFAAENGYEKAYGSYEEMLADPAVDLVYIATPHSLHAQQALLCIEHGKAVLCEKPFTGNVAQAEAVFRRGKEKGVLVAEAMWTRYMPQAKKLRALVDEGAIGEVHLVTAGLCYRSAHIPRMAQPELAGGALLDLGVYPLTFAALVLGSEPQGMTCDGQLTELGVDAQNTVTLRYPEGRMALLHSSMLVNGESGGVVYGTKGRIEATRNTDLGMLRVYDETGDLTATFQREEGYNGYEYEIIACMKALEEDALECPDMPHAETLRIMRQMDAIRAYIGVVYPFDEA